MNSPDTYEAQLKIPSDVAVSKLFAKHFGYGRVLFHQLLTEGKFVADSSKSELAQIDAIRLAYEFWKRLVKALGRRRAKELMDFLMGTNKAGRHGDCLLEIVLFIYLDSFGQHETNAEIAQRIIESDPYRVKWGSGEVRILNDDICGEDVPDEAIVEEIALAPRALEKQIRLLRHWALKEGLLSKEYAPRPYRRD